MSAHGSEGEGRTSRQGASDLYSLLEYRIDGKIVRNDASFEKDYLLGRYGAIPLIGDVRDRLGARDREAEGRQQSAPAADG